MHMQSRCGVPVYVDIFSAFGGVSCSLQGAAHVASHHNTQQCLNDDHESISFEQGAGGGAGEDRPNIQRCAHWSWMSPDPTALDPTVPKLAQPQTHATCAGT